MATFDIKEPEFNTSDELVIKIDNPDYTLRFTALGPEDIEYHVHPPKLPDNPYDLSDLHPVQVFVKEGEANEENPNPLEFPTTMKRLGAGGKEALIYCMLISNGEKKEKKRRKTDVTVSPGGGLTAFDS